MRHAWCRDVLARWLGFSLPHGVKATPAVAAAGGDGAAAGPLAGERAAVERLRDGALGLEQRLGSPPRAVAAVHRRAALEHR